MRRSAIRRKRKSLAKEEERETKRQKRFNIQVHQEINSFKQLLHKKYGFIADPALPTYQNFHKAILSTPAEIYFSQPKNKAVFNLTTSTTNTLPAGTYLLLVLGLKFVIKAGCPVNKIQASLD